MAKKLIALLMTVLLVAALAACGTEESKTDTQAATEATAAAAQETTSDGDEDTITAIANVTADGAIDATDMFTDRDLRQNADLSEAVSYTLLSGSDISITSDGVYVISGSADNVTITVDAADEDKVQIVLDGADITNDDFPCIYVKNADKVFVTTAADTKNSLSVTGTFSADGTTNTDAVIFSRDDLVLNGLGTLNISSTDNGVSCKDDLKITGGTINITCVSDALEANDSIAVAGGSITIDTAGDGLHAENDEDNATGYVYICGGTFDIDADDDGIHGTTVVQIDDGKLTISASEGIEGTYIQINGGTIDISASDDGINAAQKSGSYQPTFEMNGGYITIVMGQGDTDGIDSNGYLYFNGGTVDITCNSPFDYDISAEYNGGTVIVNGEETTTITNQMMGGQMGVQPGGMVQNGGMQPGGNMLQGGQMGGGMGGF